MYQNLPRPSKVGAPPPAPSSNMLTATRYGLLLISSPPYHIKKTTLTLAKNHGCEQQEEEDQQPAVTPRHNYLHTPAIGLYGFLALLALAKQHYMRRSSALDCRRFLAATTLPLCVAGFYGNTYTNTAQAGKGAYFHYKHPHKMCIAL